MYRRLQRLGAIVPGLHRFVSVPGVWLTTAVVTALLFPLLVVALGVDLLRRRRELPSVRVVLFAFCFGWVESLGIVSLFCVGALTLGRVAARRSITYAVQRIYTAALYGSASWLLSLSIEVQGDALVDAGPLLVLMRHSSILDTLLPGVLLTGKHDLALRYVLKRELRWGPCLDIAGHWLPNHFVSRGSNDSAKEIAAVAALKQGLVAGEGVLLYPEGTRFSEVRRARALAAMPPHLAERAARLTHLLPPRLGGTLALLSAAPACDVLLFAHTGLERFRTVRDIWAGHLIGKTIRVQFFRIRASEIPTEREAQISFLYDAWQRVDDWVGHAG